MTLPYRCIYVKINPLGPDWLQAGIVVCINGSKIANELGKMAADSIKTKHSFYMSFLQIIMKTPGSHNGKKYIPYINKK